MNITKITITLNAFNYKYEEKLIAFMASTGFTLKKAVDVGLGRKLTFVGNVQSLT